MSINDDMQMLNFVLVYTTLRLSTCLLLLHSLRTQLIVGAVAAAGGVIPLLLLLVLVLLLLALLLLLVLVLLGLVVLLLQACEAAVRSQGASRSRASPAALLKNRRAAH